MVSNSGQSTGDADPAMTMGERFRSGADEKSADISELIEECCYCGEFGGEMA